jgi:UDPglucose--hexose-1-phosphate uridylyltransferase
MAGELRKDPMTGRWVLVRMVEEPPPPDGADPDPCPFCPGSEHLTPPEIAAYRAGDGSPGSSPWHVRVFPESNPYFRIEEELVREGVGMFDRVSIRGASEIVVEDPGHWVNLADMEEDQLRRVLWMYRDRIADLQRDGQIRSVVVTRRHGKQGARIRHPYSRVLATPIVFDDLRAELAQAREYYAYKRRCVYCDATREELSAGERLVRATTHFAAFIPYAARSPFELRVLPRLHACAFDQVSDDQVGDLARVLRDLARALTKALDDPPFEMVLHTAPNLSVKVLQSEWETVAKDYHWHLELTARPEHWTTVGGIAVNETPPERAAQILREAAGGDSSPPA